MFPTRGWETWSDTGSFLPFSHQSLPRVTLVMATFSLCFSVLIMKWGQQGLLLPRSCTGRVPAPVAHSGEALSLCPFLSRTRQVGGLLLSSCIYPYSIPGSKFSQRTPHAHKSLKPFLPHFLGFLAHITLLILKRILPPSPPTQTSPA